MQFDVKHYLNYEWHVQANRGSGKDGILETVSLKDGENPGLRTQVRQMVLFMPLTIRKLNKLWISLWGADIGAGRPGKGGIWLLNLSPWKSDLKSSHKGGVWLQNRGFSSQHSNFQSFLFHFLGRDKPRGQKLGCLASGRPQQYRQRYSRDWLLYWNRSIPFPAWKMGDAVYFKTVAQLVCNI